MTRGKTAVAMALEASFQPFDMSKKMAPTTTSQPITPRVSTPAKKSIRRTRSGVPDHDRLDHVRHVLARVGRALEIAVDVLPLDDLDRVAVALEEHREPVLLDAVPLRLLALHLEAL